jgi:hypothetical protein
MSREDVIELGMVSGVITVRVSPEEKKGRRAVDGSEAEVVGWGGSLSLTHRREGQTVTDRDGCHRFVETIVIRRLSYGSGN